MRARPFAEAASLTLFVACAGAGTTAPHAASSTGPAPDDWVSAPTTTPPVIDGLVDEAWRRAQPLTVIVREAIGGQRPIPVELRALHTADTLYVLARWPDSTRSDMRDPYVWNPASGAYDRPSRPDDQFALEFPLRGDFDLSMLTLDHEYEADVWHWKAGRGNPVGWVDDKRHIIGSTPTPKAKEYSLGGHGAVFVARLLDDGTSAYAAIPVPESYGGDVVDSFAPREPSGSAADVRGKGVHDGAQWTLEMARKLRTGHSDDAVIDPVGENVCAVAVLDDELYWHHSVSGRIRLRFTR